MHIVSMILVVRHLQARHTNEAPFKHQSSIKADRGPELLGRGPGLAAQAGNASAFRPAVGRRPSCLGKKGAASTKADSLLPTAMPQPDSGWRATGRCLPLPLPSTRLAGAAPNTALDGGAALPGLRSLYNPTLRPSCFLAAQARLRSADEAAAWCWALKTSFLIAFLASQRSPDCQTKEIEDKGSPSVPTGRIGHAAVWPPSSAPWQAADVHSPAAGVRAVERGRARRDRGPLFLREPGTDPPAVHAPVAPFNAEMCVDPLSIQFQSAPLRTCNRGRPLCAWQCRRSWSVCLGLRRGTVRAGKTPGCRMTGLWEARRMPPCHSLAASVTRPAPSGGRHARAGPTPPALGALLAFVHV